MNKIRIDRFQLKLIAIAAMCIDHVGAVFFPGILFLRIIGRIAFPIFAFMISEGYGHTSNIYKYMARLLIFACISAYPFYLVFGSWKNVFFTLFFGLIALFLYDVTEKKIGVRLISYCPVIIIAVFCGLAEFDWGFLGILMIFIFYRVGNDFTKTFSFSVIAVMSHFFFLSLKTKLALDYFIYNRIYYVGIVVPLILISFYDGRKGKDCLLIKYLFYIFYPLHLLVIFQFMK